MKYRTNDFICPAARIMIYAEYNEETKKLNFEIADGYFYTQDRNNTEDNIRVNLFIQKNNSVKNDVEEANNYLKELGINETLEKK